MDGARFDAFAKTLAAGRSRRGVLRALAAAFAGLSGAAAVQPAGAWPHPGGPCNQDGSCPLGEHCVDHFCVCDNGSTPCAARCSDLENDPFNCGACGHACLPGVGCYRGRCECDAPLCGSECCPNPWFCDLTTNTCRTDCPDDRRPCGFFDDNFGDSSVVCCPPGEACIDPAAHRCGKCPPETPVCNGFDRTDNDCCKGVCCNQVCCPEGRNCCGGVSCCDPARGFICYNAVCACPENWKLCGKGDDAYCADLQDDPNNCGACGRVCSDGAGCVKGVCCPAARACPDRCCPPFQECCADGSCKLKGLCCPKERVCGDQCCTAGEQCCDGDCRPADTACACPPERDCTDYDLGCCAEGTYCGLDYDGNPICCNDALCGDDQFCCGEGDVCAAASDGPICCGPKALTSDGQCCGIASLKRIACGVNCCDEEHEVCIGGECCSKTMVAGGECCKYIPPCNGKCCGVTENCGSWTGEPEHCIEMK